MATIVSVPRRAFLPHPPSLTIREGWRRQLLLYLGAYGLYSVARYLFIGDLATARDHAHAIVELEGGVDLERSVQHAFDAGAPIWFLNHIYVAAQLVVVPGALALLYRYSMPVYRWLRNTILFTWMIAVPIYALYPCAPPRLADVGLADTMASGGHSAMNSPLATKFFNPLAAVPSLHAGFAFAVGIAVYVAVKPRWAKALGLLWGPLVTVAVLATGNHFAFDVVAGIAVTLVAFGLSRIALGARPTRLPILAPAG